MRAGEGAFDGHQLASAHVLAGAGAVLTQWLIVAARCGPLLMAGSAALGLAWPGLAAAMRTLFPLALLLLAFSAFLQVGLADLQAAVRLQWRLTAVVLAWTTLGAPLVVAMAVHAAGLEGAAAQAAVLAAAGPPTLGAAGIAIMLRLDPVLPTASALLGMVLAPFTIPALSVAVLGVQPGIDPAFMTLRLLAIVGGGAALAWFVRRTRPALAANPALASNTAAAMLAVFAIGATAGMGEQAAAHPAQLALLTGLAFACNVGGQAAGALLFAGLGAYRALAIGVASGSRNVSMQWTALGAAADGPIATYFALCLVLHTLLPLLQQATLPLLKAALAAARRPRPARAAAR